MNLGPLSDLFNGHGGGTAKKGELVVLPTALDEEKAALLDRPVGTPTFRLEYVVYDFDDVPFGWGWFTTTPEVMNLKASLGLWEGAEEAKMRKKNQKNLSHEMKELAVLVSELKEDEVLARVQRHIESGTPPAELLSACQEGMRLVGLMHEKGQYFIAGLIMAGEIMYPSSGFASPCDDQRPLRRKRGTSGIGDHRRRYS